MTARLGSIAVPQHLTAAATQLLAVPMLAKK